MRACVLVVLAVAACSSPTEPRPSAPPSSPTPAPAPTETAPSTPAPTTPAPTAPLADAPAKPTPDLCTALCVESRQMQAMAIEAIEAACKSDCDARAAAPIDPACVQAAAAARKRVEKVPMNRRAKVVWQQIDATLACGHHDAVLARLAEIGSADGKTREADFLEALAGDTFFARLCPGGIDVARQAAAQPHDGRTKQLAQACPLTGVEVEGAARDLPVGTLLAIETVALRWKAFAADSSDHRILLDTLRLSSALAAEPR